MSEGEVLELFRLLELEDPLYDDDSSNGEEEVQRNVADEVQDLDDCDRISIQDVQLDEVLVEDVEISATNDEARLSDGEIYSSTDFDAFTGFSARNSPNVAARMTESMTPATSTRLQSPNYRGPEALGEDESLSGGENAAIDAGEQQYVAKSGLSWTTVPQRAQRRRTARNILHVTPGPNGRADDPELSITGMFSLFLDDEILSTIVDFTNERMEREVASGRRAQWKRLDVIELKAFVGLLLLLGVLSSKKEPINEIWSTDSAITRPVFRACMSRKRFLDIHRNITFDDVQTRAERKQADKLAAFRNMADAFAERFRRYYHPSAHVTIDEHLVAFRGHCGFRVYMANKPDRYGIKVSLMLSFNFILLTTV